MIIVGLDLSLSGTGMARIVDPGEIQTGLVGTSPKQPGPVRMADERWEMNRFGSALTRVKQFVEAERPDLIVIEDFAFSVQGAGARSNAGFGYLVRYWLYVTAKIPFLLVGNSQLKKFCVGKSAEKGSDGKMHGTPKEVVIREVFNLWGLSIDNNNQADAVVLAKIGQAVTDPVFNPSPRATGKVIQSQKEVIAALVKQSPWVRDIGAKVAA